MVQPWNTVHHFHWPELTCMTLMKAGKIYHMSQGIRGKTGESAIRLPQRPLKHFRHWSLKLRGPELEIAAEAKAIYVQESRWSHSWRKSRGKSHWPRRELLNLTIPLRWFGERMPRNLGVPKGAWRTRPGLCHGNFWVNSFKQLVEHTVKCLEDVNSKAASQIGQLPESSLSPVLTCKGTGQEGPKFQLRGVNPEEPQGGL